MKLSYHYIGIPESTAGPAEPILMSARFNPHRRIIWMPGSCDLTFDTFDCLGNLTTTEFELAGDPKVQFDYFAGPTAARVLDYCLTGARPRHFRFWGIKPGRIVEVRGSSQIPSLALAPRHDGTYGSNLTEGAEKTVLYRRWEAFLNCYPNSRLGKVTGISRSVD